MRRVETQTAPILWDAPNDGGRWQLRFRLLDIDGRAECVGVSIRRAPEDKGQPVPLKGKTIRSLDFAGRLLEARRLTAQVGRDLGAVVVRFADEPVRPGWYHTGISPERARELRAAAEAHSRFVDPQDGTKGGRRARYTREDLELVAVVYQDAYANGEPPAKAVAASLDISDVQARKLVWRCRGVGLLPPAEGEGIAGWVRPAGEEEA